MSGSSPGCSRVAAPLPVLTSKGLAPAARAACRSRIESPINGTPVRSIRRRLAISSSNPGRGLRHRQLSAGAWGQKNTASICPPASLTERYIFSWMRIRVSRSNRPRATPDWLVATTTRQPARCRRAIAARLPGIGCHSPGDLMYSSESSLMTPSRSRITSCFQTPGGNSGM